MLKKEYEKPIVEVIDFDITDSIMDIDVGGDDRVSDDFDEGAGDEW